MANITKKIYTAPEIEKILPEKLKIFRKKAGLTTQEVGRFLNKTPSAITLWETGKSMPDVYTLLKLCDIYNVADLNEFIELNVPKEAKNLAKSEQELICLWRKTPRTIKIAVKSILKYNELK